jgi:hypothetical protein
MIHLTSLHSQLTRRKEDIQMKKVFCTGFVGARLPRLYILLTTIMITAMITACDGGGSTAPTGPDAEVVIGDGAATLPGTLIRQAPQGGPNPANLSVTITNSGTGAINYTATTTTVDGKPWLSVSPTSGSLAAGTSTPLALLFDVVTTALTPGTHTGGND